MPSSSPPYDNMTEESAFDNPVYESGVSEDVTTSVRDVDSQNTSVLSWSTPPPHLAAILSCHLTVHQQRAPYGLIFHRLSDRHCVWSWKRLREEKDILSCHRDFCHRHCQFWHRLPSWVWLSSASCFVTHVIAYCVHVCRGSQSPRSSCHHKRKLKQLDWFWSLRF